MLQTFQGINKAFGILSFKESRSSHKHIRSGIHSRFCGLSVYSPVDFNYGAYSPLFAHFFYLSDFIQRKRYKLLPALAGFDCHDKYEVNKLKYVRYRINARKRFNGYASQTAAFFYEFDRIDRSESCCFLMDSYVSRSGVCECFYVFFWVDDH